jgi:hypothetical protein
VYQAACRQLAIAALQEDELRLVAVASRRAGLTPVFLKGAALAYTVYEDPALRARRDTDFIVRDQDVIAVRQLLEELGYEPVPQAPGQLAVPQFHFGRVDQRGIHHALDIHLRISNMFAYGSSLTYDELRADASPIPAIENALVPSAVHSLFIACIHRVAHHQDTPRLLWLFDIHRLGRSLGPGDWDRVVAFAAQKQLSAVLLLGLERAGEVFGPQAADHVLERLASAASREDSPPLLGGETTKLDVLRADLAAAQGWRTRAQLVREHLFPSRRYMRQAYARYPGALLPLAYVARIVRGAPKWFRRAQDL